MRVAWSVEAQSQFQEVVMRQVVCGFQSTLAPPQSQRRMKRTRRRNGQAHLQHRPSANCQARLPRRLKRVRPSEAKVQLRGKHKERPLELHQNSSKEPRSMPRAKFERRPLGSWWLLDAIGGAHAAYHGQQVTMETNQTVTFKIDMAWRPHIP